MPEIRVLPGHLVNKIAAGEVIERPASVVKELVENALDAGASAIDITVEDGGRRLISIRDNGKGMGADDLALAFAPHATSKIAGDEDLFNIRTMGFRGEALASVSAISHVHAVTRPRASDEPCGYEIRVEGETVHPVRPTAATSEGTTVTVRDMFYNTPARRKFMRTANTEFGHVVEQLTRLALPNCEVAFTLTHNGRATHRLPVAQILRQRVADLLGAELAEMLIEFCSKENATRVSGLIAPPHQGRASGRWQYFFVNGRYVRDRLLAHALREAYRGLIEPSRAPVAIVFLETDPSEIDVNVHPTKIEVRFRNGQFIHSQLLGALRETLNKADIAPTVRIDSAAAPASDMADDDRRQSLKQALADFFKSGPQTQGPPGSAAPETYEGARPRQAPSRPDFGPPKADRAADWREPARRIEAPPGRLAIQIHNAYIVAATDDGLAIFDQHALHERILFEGLKQRILAGSLSSQRLLIPETVEVGEFEKAVLTERADLLGRLGLDLTEFGPGSVAVHAMPALLVERKVSAVEFVRDLLEMLADLPATGHISADLPAGEASGAELLDHVLATMACKAAVKAGDALTDEEIDALLARQEEIDKRGSCPHGRPTTLKMTLAELEKQFKRT